MPEQRRNHYAIFINVVTNTYHLVCNVSKLIPQLRKLRNFQCWFERPNFSFKILFISFFISRLATWSLSNKSCNLLLQLQQGKKSFIWNGKKHMDFSAWSGDSNKVSTPIKFTIKQQEIFPKLTILKGHGSTVYHLYKSYITMCFFEYLKIFQGKDGKNLKDVWSIDHI